MFSTDAALRCDAENAKFRSVMIILTWIRSPGVKEELTINPFCELMMGMSKDDHIRIREIMGKVLIIAFELITLADVGPFIDQVIQH